jgi:hypothetical protein
LNEAERLALAAAAEAQRAGPGKNSEAIKAFELAGWAADGRVEYADAIERLRAAEKLTDRTRDPVEWARVQFALAYMLDDQGQYSLTEGILREVLKEREHVLGPEHPDTLSTCYDLARCLHAEGANTAATDFARRAANGARMVLGADHPDTKKYEKLQQELLTKAE